MLNTDIVYCFLSPKPHKKCENCLRNLDNYDGHDIDSVRTYISYINPKIENGKCLMFKRLKNEH